MTSKASFYEKLFFLIVASFDPAREVKEKIASETFFNGFWREKTVKWLGHLGKLL